MPRPLQARWMKKACLEQVHILRDKIRSYTEMTREQLQQEVRTVNPYTAEKDIQEASNEAMIQILLVSATHHMTNVLDLE